MTAKISAIKTMYPTFDIDGALVNLANNALLLDKVIKSFYAQYKDNTLAEMKAFLDSGKTEEAARLAHTLKGLAGSIGAKKLQEACLALELACKEDAPTTEAFDGFSKQITNALEEISGGLKSIPNLAEIADD